MAKTITINCANCDAAMETTPEMSEVICQKCGTSQFIEQHGGIKETVENSPAPHRVIDVFRYVVRHPVEMLVWRWNWKAAFLSGIMRGSIYLFTHLKEGWRAALGAMSVEFVFRVIVSGASGSMVQSFHRAHPAWLATLCVMILLPAFSHLIEFTLHTLNGDANKGKAIIISITFSLLSAIFNLFAMRRGTLLVKDKDEQSLWNDMKQMPWIVGEFLLYPFTWLWRKFISKQSSIELSKTPEAVEEKFS